MFAGSTPGSETLNIALGACVCRPLVPTPTLTVTPYTSHMLPDPFTTEDGDVVLRVGPDDTFRVHKLVLSLASPVFNDLFQSAQPDTPDEGREGTPPTLSLTDAPEAVDLLLRFIYPGVVPPTITNLAVLSALLTIADKYNVSMVPPVVKERLAAKEMLEKDPLGVYIEACRWRFTDETKAAARRLTPFKIMDSPSLRNLHNLSEDDLFRLRWFIEKRGQEGKKVIREYAVWNTDPVLGEIPCGHKVHSGTEAEKFYRKLAEEIADEFEFDPCLGTEQMNRILTSGPDPPSTGFCKDIDANPIQEAFTLYCPTRPSRIVESLDSLASRLEWCQERCLTKAFDGELPE